MSTTEELEKFIYDSIDSKYSHDLVQLINKLVQEVIEEVG